MTATLMPPESMASTPRAQRMLPIAANLLPMEIVDWRRTRQVRRIVLSALVAVVVLLASWYGLARYQTSTAGNGLNGVERHVENLQKQQGAFADVIGVQTESRAIHAQLSSLLAGDLEWSRLLSALQAAAPRTVHLSGVTGQLLSATTGGGSVAAQLPDGAGRKSIGTLTVTGTGSDKPAVAAYVDALAKVPGLGSPLLGGATMQDGALQFTVRLDITDAALGGRYTSTANTGPGGK
jgi:Tfp pilus assembly protein PilN